MAASVSHRSSAQGYGQATRLAWRLLKREWRAGELRVLLAALVITVGSISAVGLFTERMERAMVTGASELLAADLLLASPDPVDASVLEEARRRGLRVARTLSFRSVTVVGERFQLAEVKAVDDAYPLRGRLRVATTAYGADEETTAVPAAGTVWLDPRLMSILGVTVGERLELGAAELPIERVLSYEPDRGGDLFHIAPRLLMNLADVPRTELVQRGSRVEHRLLLAGESTALDAFRDWLAARLEPNQRIQGIRDARPEIRTALERAEQFLGLAALVSVLLAGVAIAVAARRHARRHLDAAALLRCLGASQATIVRIYAIEVLLLGAVGSLAGCGLGAGAQALLARLLGTMIVATLPPPPWAALAAHAATGIAVLAAFALPPILRLRDVSPSRVLRRELGGLPRTTLGAYGAAALLCVALVFWHANDALLGAYVLGGGALAILALLAAARGLVRVLNRVRRHAGVAWRFGLANITRHADGSAVQMVAFGVGITMLLAVTLVRGHLLETWRAQLPEKAPNYFLVNVQPDEVQALDAHLAARGLASAALYPMVRGRLVAIDDRPVDPENYEEPRAQRLASREFNLSWSAELHPDNRIVAGRWWTPAEHDEALLSVERGIAEALGFALGDTLTFRVAGRELTARIQSLREVQWDSFNVNFFVVAPPGLLDAFPATYITSFHLPAGRDGVLVELIRRFPSVTVIDVDALMATVREIMDRANLGVRFVSVFTLLAGFTVLLAAIQSTLDERRYDTAIIRTLGADRRSVMRGIASEFLTLGALAGLLGALAATGLAGILAAQVFHLDYRPDPWLWIAGVLAGSLGIGAAGWLGTRPVLRHPPLESLRRI